MYEGNGNYAKYSKFSRFKIGCPFKRMYLEKKKHFPVPILVLNVLVYIFEVKK